MKNYFTFVYTIIVMTNNREKMNRDLVVAVLRAGNHFNEELNQFVKTFGISLPQFNVSANFERSKRKTGQPLNHQ